MDCSLLGASGRRHFHLSSMPEFSDEPDNPGIAGQSVQACREARGGNLCNMPMGVYPFPSLTDPP